MHDSLATSPRHAQTRSSSKRSLLLACLLCPPLVAAQDCPNVGNLVGNCGFNQNVAGYTGQEPGDVVAHEPVLGAALAGSMRVTDTPADGDDAAEAETCVNLPSGREYTIGASFRAIAANQCYVGYDEHVGPNCGAPNGFFSPSTPISVNTTGFQRFSASKTVGAGVVSIELVILCTRTDQGSTEFLVDDVFVTAGTPSPSIFANGFERPPGR